VFNSFQLLDSLWPRISDTFSAVSGVPVVESDLVYGGMPAAGAMLLLDELELSARLFYQLIGSYSSWKRRRPELSGRYLRLCLPVLRQLVDWLSHPNRFNAAQANANGADSSKETDGSIQLLSIVECLLSTIYVLTYAWQPFQCRQDDWDAPIAVFVPSLTITAPSDPMVALGTLNSLLAYCCKDNPAGQKSADQRKLANRLLATAELAMTLFITQTVYSLSSPLVDPRQREQIRLEIGGELAAAVDAFASKGSGEYFSRLRSYVQRIK
jgi:hypothetical protein